MAHGHPFKDCNLIPDLGKSPQSALPLQISESTTPRLPQIPVSALNFQKMLTICSLPAINLLLITLAA